MRTRCVLHAILELEPAKLAFSLDLRARMDVPALREFATLRLHSALTNREPSEVRMGMPVRPPISASPTCAEPASTLQDLVAIASRIRSIHVPTIANAALESALVARALSQTHRLRDQTDRRALLQLSAKAMDVMLAPLQLKLALPKAQEALHAQPLANAKTVARPFKELACTVQTHPTEPFATTTVNAQAGVATSLKERTRPALRPLPLVFVHQRLPYAEFASTTTTVDSD